MRRFTKKWKNQIVLFAFSTLFLVKKSQDKKVFESIWSEIWHEQGYEESIEEFTQYDSVSTDFLLYFLFWPCGTLRIVHNNPKKELPVFHDFSIEKKLWKTENIKEITLFTVKKEFRGVKLFYLPLLMLIRHLARLGKRKNVEGWVMMVDKRLFRFLRQIKIPIYQIGKEKFYKGSVTYPAYINNLEFLKMMRKINPFLAL